MTARYITAPRRYSDNDNGEPASPTRADFWIVFDAVDAGDMKVVCRCDDADLAGAVAAGLAAGDELEALKAHNEACRLAACFALGTDTATLEEAITALCAGHEGKVIELLSRATATEQVGSAR